MYRLIDHKQQILRPKGDQSFHTVWAQSRPSALTYLCPKTSLPERLLLALSAVQSHIICLAFCKQWQDYLLPYLQ